MSDVSAPVIARADPDAPVGTILILDEKPICREALGRFVAELAPGSKLAFAASVAEAMTLVDADPPRVMLIDLFTTSYDFAAIQRLVAAAAPAPAVALDDRMNPTFARLARDAGAWGYLAKQQDSGAMRVALKAVLAGRPTFPPDIAPFGRSMRGPPGLTARQLEVLKKMAAGKSNKEIAEALGITPGTVKLHIHAILKLTGARNRTEAALIAGRFIAPTLG